MSSALEELAAHASALRDSAGDALDVAAPLFVLPAEALLLKTQVDKKDYSLESSEGAPSPWKPAESASRPPHKRIRTPNSLYANSDLLVQSSLQYNSRRSPGQDEEEDDFDGYYAGGRVKKCKLPDEAVRVLKAWLLSPEHIDFPYPTDEEKRVLAEKCHISIRQLTNWFTNGRKRIWIPLRKQEGRRIVPYAQARAVQRMNELATFTGVGRAPEPLSPEDSESAPEEAPRQAPRRPTGGPARLTPAPTSAADSIPIPARPVVVSTRCPGGPPPPTAPSPPSPSVAEAESTAAILERLNAEREALRQRLMAVEAQQMRILAASAGGYQLPQMQQMEPWYTAGTGVPAQEYYPVPSYFSPVGYGYGPMSHHRMVLPHPPPPPSSGHPPGLSSQQ